MLRLLKIRNIAVVESCDISFDTGFSVLTGETGAGKSMIIDAVRMIIGERISRDLIRTGEKKASVEADFSFREPYPEAVRELVDKEGKLTVYREINSEGKNRCLINQTAVPISGLKELGEHLVDIHGQHDSRNLLDPARHIGYIDIFAGLENDLRSFRTCYAEYKRCRRELNGKKMDESEKLRRIEMLEYQINDIESADISSQEEETISARKKILSNAEKISERLQSALQALNGQNGGASDAISSALGDISFASRYAEDLSGLEESLRDIQYALEGVVGDLENNIAGMEYSPEELNDIEDRLDTYYRMKKKYGATVEEVLQFLANIRSELDNIRRSDQYSAELEKKMVQLKQETDAKAKTLSEKRTQASTILSKKIEEELAYLDMPNTRFQVEFFPPEEGETTLTENGQDVAEFYLAVNKGENAKQLSKTASGGELSRIMLAMKNVLTDKDSIPVQIFDEIDTGISGRAAQKVANKMWQLARGRQVLCVTHLPQLAAMADNDYLIEKREKAGRTVTEVHCLSGEERSREIARINVGEGATELAISSAREILEQCQRIKQELS